MHIPKWSKNLLILSLLIKILTQEISLLFQYQCFFTVFTTFRKLEVIQLILAVQTIFQMKDIVRGSLLIESIFEITSEEVEKSVYENPFFKEGVEIHTSLVLKGLNFMLASSSFLISLENDFGSSS